MLRPRRLKARGKKNRALTPILEKMLAARAFLARGGGGGGVRGADGEASDDQCAERGLLGV